MRNVLILRCLTVYCALQDGRSEPLEPHRLASLIAAQALE